MRGRGGGGGRGGVGKMPKMSKKCQKKFPFSFSSKGRPKRSFLREKGGDLTTSRDCHLVKVISSGAVVDYTVISPRA